MHELGIVQHIVKTLEEVAEENSLKKIVSVTLEVGEVSTIVPEQLIDCWDYFSRKKELVCGAELKLDIIPAVTWCDSCKSTYETVKYGKICPVCGSEKTWLLAGNECSIKEILVNDEDDS